MYLQKKGYKMNIDYSKTIKPLNPKQKEVVENFISNEVINKGRKLLLLGHTGSILYGTNSELSDVDLKGVFIPSIDELLMNEAPQELLFSTGKKDGKNDADDIDITLFSIHKFFNLMKKGETNTYDLFFSMFVEKDMLFFLDTEFYNVLIPSGLYKKFFTKQFNAFVGYCVTQTQKYGVKGERLANLKELIDITDKFISINTDTSLRINDLVKDNLFKDFITKAKHVKLSLILDKNYINVIGKSFIFNMTITEFSDKLKSIKKQYGDRAESSSKGIDYKSLSHAVRVMLECEELIDTGHINFPLEYAPFIKSIKYNDGIESEVIFDYLRQKLDLIEIKLESAEHLPNKISDSNKQTLNKVLLQLIKQNY